MISIKIVVTIYTSSSIAQHIFPHVWGIDIEYNKRLDHQRPCLEDDLTAGSNL